MFFFFKTSLFKAASYVQITFLSASLQGLHDIGAITNHMTEDTLNIMQFFWISHYAWAIPFKVRIGQARKGERGDIHKN